MAEAVWGSLMRAGDNLHDLALVDELGEGKTSVCFKFTTPPPKDSRLVLTALVRGLVREAGWSVTGMKISKSQIAFVASKAESSSFKKVSTSRR